MSPLTWRVDVGRESILVAVGGRPDERSVAALRASLGHYADRRPDCLFLDLSEMPVEHRAPLIGLSLPVAHGSMASGTVVLLCGPPGGQVARHRCPGRRATLGRDFAEAREVLDWGLLSAPSFVEQVLPVAGAARRSRDLVTDACISWGLPHLTGPAALIASELVGHSIRRSSTLMTVVALRHGRDLYLWVRAGSGDVPITPQERATADLATVIIDTLADRWGFLPDDPDTLMWAALAAV